jgi:hypothetical protein
MRFNRSVGLFISVLASCLASSAALAADWNPGLLIEAETVDLRTVGAEEGEYWFPVWVVVVDDQVFVRLGSRAADRMRANQAGSRIAVRLGEQQFDVETQDAPDYAGRVADAMAEKYWSDIFVRYFDHPMTLRLVVAPPAPASALHH